MALQNLLEYSWFKDLLEDESEVESYESNFKASRLTQDALVKYIDHRVAELDKELSLPKLKEMSDRGEMALIVAAQRDALMKIRILLLE